MKERKLDRAAPAATLLAFLNDDAINARADSLQRQGCCYKQHCNECLEQLYQ